jgi:hypothetical protein
LPGWYRDQLGKQVSLFGGLEGYQQAEGWQEMFALIIQPTESFDMTENTKDMASACGVTIDYLFIFLARSYSPLFLCQFLPPARPSGPSGSKKLKKPSAKPANEIFPGGYVGRSPTKKIRRKVSPEY